MLCGKIKGYSNFTRKFDSAGEDIIFISEVGVFRSTDFSNMFKWDERVRNYMVSEVLVIGVIATLVLLAAVIAAAYLLHLQGKEHRRITRRPIRSRNFIARSIHLHRSEFRRCQFR